MIQPLPVDDMAMRVNHSEGDANEEAELGTTPGLPAALWLLRDWNIGSHRRSRGG